MPINAFIARLFRPEVLALSVYKVADATGLIKLDAMENPYGWPEELKIQWLEKLKQCELNRYPDPEAKTLSHSIRQLYHISDDLGLLLGNGSDEIIQLLLMAVPTGANVISPAPGFVMYQQISQLLGLNYLGVPLKADSFALDLPAMLTAIQQQQPAVVFLAYPNNPTGNLFDTAAIHEIIQASPGLVVIDEAYAPFANASLIDALGQYPNLLIMRTVSKLGLAGLRLGYLVGHPAIIEQLNKIRLPYNINILTQVSVEFALSHHPVFTAQAEAICQERSRIFEQLSSLEGITPYPSAANFILFKTPTGQANQVFASLKEQTILIKNLAAHGGLLSDCLRVTVGTPEQDEHFMTALKISLTQ
ncbi:MAG: histidinol-phosphate transaminase [Methylococcaceae bacterium]|jgi:histidinol-phosphate aminotransferase